MKILLDEGTTEFCLEDTGKEGYRLAIHNRYINYESIGHLFCYGDIKYTTMQVKKFINGELKEVICAGTTEPNLNIIFRPKGAKAIRETGEDVGDSYDEYNYAENTIIIEVDLCLAYFSEQHWSASLSEEETKEFCKQWLAEMQE